MSRQCSECECELPDGALFCSSCGAELGSAGAANQIRSPVLAPKLALANLARLRQDWREAEQICIGVLRADPNNVHAHSLLGDIYRDQGRDEDARQWYQLALDLYPESRADKAKLERLDSRSSARTNGDAGPQLLGEPTEGRLLGLPAAVWVRTLTAIALLFTICAAVVFAYQRYGRPDAVSQRPSSAQFPLGSRAPAGGLAATPDPRLPGPSSAADQPAPSLRSSSAEATMAQTIEIESRAAAAVASVGALGDGLSFQDVVADHESGLAILLFELRPPIAPLDLGGRRSVLQAILRASAATFAAESRLTRLSVMLRGLDENGGRRPLLRATTTRALASVPETDQPDGSFASITWFGPEPSAGGGVPGTSP